MDDKDILRTDKLRRIVPASGSQHLRLYVGSFDFEGWHVTRSDPSLTSQYLPSGDAKRLEWLVKKIDWRIILLGAEQVISSRELRLTDYALIVGPGSLQPLLPRYSTVPLSLASKYGCPPKDYCLLLTYKERSDKPTS